VLFELRHGDDSDLGAIMEAYIASWRAGYAGLLPETVVDEQAELRRQYDWLVPIESSFAEVIVAVAGANVVGVIEAGDRPRNADNLPEIEMLYVIPQWWGTDVAKDLLVAGTNWIAARGHSAARLRVVEVQTRARRFYEREGWQLDDDMAPASNGLYRLVYYRRRLERAI
jgi:GNAT superfamily N-acetyltransferase